MYLYIKQKGSVEINNILIKKDPEGCKEWDYKRNSKLNIFPDKITYGSNKKVFWICPKKHSYEMPIKAHTKGTRCPYCAGKKVLIGFNDLLTIKPSVKSEWDYEKNDKLNIYPNKITAHSGKTVWWICDKKHSYKAPVVRHMKGHGCPYCGGKKIMVGFNDLLSVDPEGCKEWDYEKNGKIGLYPEQIFPSSNKKIWWKCQKGHSYKATASDHKQGYGCPYCSGRLPVKGETDLLTVDPDGCKEWNYEKNDNLGLKPDSVTSGSNIKVWWKCPLNHDYQMIIKSHTNGHRCRICDGKEILAGFNDLATKDPECIKEWNYEKNNELGLKPTEVALFNRKIAWWKCNNGHNYQMSISQHSKGNRCPICNESNGEQKIREFLKINDILFEAQYIFSDCKNKRSLPFDFAVLKNNKVILLIEYDGEQHYRPVCFGGISNEEAEENFEKTKINDKIKDKYAKDNKIPLLRISYEKFNNIEDILKKRLHI
jgi:DNA-directed RNA polymerase subunit RPC12/RpoP